MDVLSELLATVELSSRLWFRAELGGPFALAVPAEPGGGAGVIRFHVATEGGCAISVGRHAPVRVRAGDLVMIPHGAAHVIADAPGLDPTPLADALEAAGFDGVGPLRLGGDGPGCVVVCGQLTLGDAALHPFVSSLPPSIHLAADGATHYGWVEQLLRHMEREARTRATGHVEVIRRLSEILLIQVLREHAGAGGIGTLSALADPQLGPVLQSLHAEPARDWSLDDLARLAGLSRTLLAERFRARMGVPPMKYLTGWRMQKARSLLVGGDASVGEVAQRVGYASESAFNRTFREQFGAPPGAYRRRRLGA